MITTILFDMDGVLIDSKTAWFEVFNETLKNFGNKPITEDEFELRVWAQDLKNTAKFYFKQDINTLRDHFAKLYPIFQKNLTQMQGVAQVLKSLNYKKAVITNTATIQAERILTDLNLNTYFDLILGSDNLPGKPAPDIIFKAIQILKSQPNQTVVIGDTEWDEQAANNAKTFFIGFKYGKNRIQNLSELPNKIKCMQ